MAQGPGRKVPAGAGVALPDCRGLVAYREILCVSRVAAGARSTAGRGLSAGGPCERHVALNADVIGAGSINRPLNSVIAPNWRTALGETSLRLAQ